MADEKLADLQENNITQINDHQKEMEQLKDHQDKVVNELKKRQVEVEETVQTYKSQLAQQK